jgi:hypothetical protein
MAEELHVLFGGRQIGQPLARILLDRGKRVRILKRSAGGLPEVLRNDHQNATGAGLGVSEFASQGKAVAEIRELWTWVRRKLGIRPADHERALVA